MKHNLIGSAPVILGLICGSIQGKAQTPNAQLFLEGWALQSNSATNIDIRTHPFLGRFVKSLQQNVKFAHLYLEIRSPNFCFDIHGLPFNRDSRTQFTDPNAQLKVVVYTCDESREDQRTYGHSSLPEKTLNFSGSATQLFARLLDMGSAINAANLSYQLPNLQHITIPPLNSNAAAAAELASINQCPMENCPELARAYLSIGYPAPGINAGLAARIPTDNFFRRRA